MLSKEQQQKILDILLAEKRINPGQYQEFKNELEKRGGDVLVKLETQKIVKSDDVAQAIATLFGLEYEKLDNFQADLKALQFLPEDFANNYQVAVFAKEGDLIKVALIDPTNLKAMEAIEFLAREKNLRVQYCLTKAESLANLLRQYSGLKTEVSEALDVAKGKLEEKQIRGEKKEEPMDLAEVVKSAPVAKIISVIFKHAVEGRASDIHIEPFSNNSRVRYRIDGDLETSLILPKYIHSALVSRVKVLANLKIDETRIPQDGRIRLNIGGNDVDFRISTMPLYEQEKVVIRILDTSSGALTLDQLGFDGRNLKVIEDNINKPHGMFLVTGPTGSGKSTTLYSVLNILNKEEVNIVTLEDPVEYYLTGVNQSQIRPEVGLTFARGLRSILRQDPDIVMVGEIRDSETAQLAIHASLTGHIVLSTLHTNDAFGAIPRLVDMKVESFLISSTVNVIIAQRLVRKICAECKEEFILPNNVKEEVLSEIKNIVPASLPADFKNQKNIKFYHGKGCPVCKQIGYKGRVAIAEVLEINDDVKKIITDGTFNDHIDDEAKKQGMVNLKQDGLIKAMQGKTTIEEIMRATKE